MSLYDIRETHAIEKGHEVHELIEVLAKNHSGILASQESLNGRIRSSCSPHPTANRQVNG